MFNLYALIALLLLFLGFAGIIIRRNIFTILMSVELMLNSIALLFACIARAQGVMDGHIIVLLIIALAAAEAAFGLGLVVLLYKNKQSLNIEKYNELRDENAN